MAVFQGVDFAMILVYVIQWVDQDVVEHSFKNKNRILEFLRF